MPEAMFPKTDKEARDWRPYTTYRALSTRVLAVATTRVEGAWCAYIDAVDGINHEQERFGVLDYGTKLPEEWACVLFPGFSDIPYAR